MLVGVCAYFIGRNKHEEESKKIFGWFIIAAFFGYMAIDDALQLHESVGTFAGEAAKAPGTQNFWLDVIRKFPSYYWLLIFAPIFAGFGLFMLIFLWGELADQQALQLFLGGIALYVIALGLDFFDGIDRNYDMILRHTPFSFDDARHLFRAVEEFIEMVGTSFILAAFLRYWQRTQPLESS